MPEGALSLLLQELGGIAQKARLQGMRLIIGGGVGLLLRDRWVRARGSRTLRGTFFSTETGLGVLRIREHLRETGVPEDSVDLDGFLLDLRDLLE